MEENVSWIPVSRPSSPPTSPPADIRLWIEVFTLISCILSAIGSTLIILTFIIWRDLRTKARELLVYLSVTTFLASVGYAYGIIEDFHSSSTGCVVQSAITTFSETSSFFWTVAIAVYLYTLLTVQASRTLADRLVWLFHLVCWGVPLATVIVAVRYDVLGYDNSYTSVGWCWVNLDVDHRVLWMLFAGKMWEIVAYFVLPILFVLIKRRFNRFMFYQDHLTMISNQGSVITVTLKIDLKLTFIPIIFLVLHIWSTVRFVLTLCDSSAVSNPVLVLFHGVGNSFQGAANCIMFCFCNRKIRHRFLKNWRSCTGRLASKFCYDGNEDSRIIVNDPVTDRQLE